MTEQAESAERNATKPDHVVQVAFAMDLTANGHLERGL